MMNLGSDSISNIMLGDTQVQKMYLGTNLIWEFNNERLPSGYTELEYIESTATGGQYIDLDIKLYETLDTWYDVAIKFILKGNGKDGDAQYTMFGCQKNANPWPGTFIRRYNSDVIGRYMGGTAKDNTIGTVNNPTPIELPVQTAPNMNVTNLNNNGQTHDWGTSLFCVFNDANNTPSRFSHARLYYFKLFLKASADSEGTLVRDMVPCKRNSDNKVGLFDKANNVFYVSPNGAEFEAGPEI